MYVFVRFWMTDIKFLFNIWLHLKIKLCFVVFLIALCSFKLMTSRPVLLRSAESFFLNRNSSHVHFCLLLDAGHQISFQRLVASQNQIMFCCVF